MYFAALLAQVVARQIGRPYRETLARTTPKRYHHPKEALRQPPFQIVGNPPAFAIVIDDLLTSGATMRLSLDALRQAGAVAFGFAYGGC